MVLAVGLFLSMLLTPSTSAVLTENEKHEWVIEVTSQGKSQVIRAFFHPDAPQKPDTSNESSHDSLSFQGSTFEGKEYRVVNKETGAMSKPFDRGVNRCCGGFVVGSKMLWVYVLSDMDTMTEPVSAAYVFVMSQKDGVPILERTIDLTGMRHAYYRYNVLRHNNWLVFSYEQTTEERSLGIMNLKSFEFKLLGRKGIIPFPRQTISYYVSAPNTQPDWCSYAVCTNGNIYTTVKNVLKSWNWKSLRWESVRDLEEHGWMRGYSLGSDDLLVAPEAIALAHKGAIFPLRDNFNDMMFVSATAGIAIVYDAAYPYAKGVLLSSKDLSFICNITKKDTKGK
jgi:hypothetical protein